MKTAYGMRISDWSSDVCSSDLIAVGPVRSVKADIVGSDHLRVIAAGDDGRTFKGSAFRAAGSEMGQTLLHRSDRKRDVEGKRVAVRVDLSGRGSINTQIQQKIKYRSNTCTLQM